MQSELLGALMKAILLWCMVLFSQFTWANEIQNEFLSNLSNNQKVLLSEFLRQLAQSECGYVIYGNKPMHVETCSLSPLRILSGTNVRSALMLKGRELWNDIGLSIDNKEIIITSFEKDSQCHIVCINRTAFLQAVHKNISLFRYVLGPRVTPEKLLREIVSLKTSFDQVLKNDSALLGILFGHGTQNAILDARYDHVANIASKDQFDEFPFVSKKLSKSWTAVPQKFVKTPSIGFNSIAEEELFLNKMLAQSNQLRAFDVCAIPNFDCHSDTKETAQLINSYSESRKKILRAIASRNFLPDVLTKLFTNVTGAIEIPRIPQQRALALPTSKEEMITKLCGIIQKTIGGKSNRFLKSFIQGVSAREKGQQKPIPNEWKRFKDISQLQKDIECCKNLEKADNYFERLSFRPDLVSLIDKGIYYKVLKEGKDKMVTPYSKNVSIQYSMQILGDKKVRDWGILKNESISSLIPGVALSLMGMAEGEERLVYIHPQYGYGEESFFAPNITIAAKIRLIHVEEGDREVQILPAHKLEVRDHKDLVTRYEVLRAEQMFDEGVEFWDSIKKSGNFIDFTAFQRIFNTSNEIDYQSPNQEQQFVSDLEYLLLSLQNND